jgi:ubiquinone/menaquinone biosynthesis C-methylase UbiE
MDLPQRIPEPEVMSDAEEARVYRAADFAAVNQAFADRFAALWSAAAGRPATPWLIDLGCGPADITLRVQRLLPACRIAAVDASEAMLAEGLPARRAAGAERAVPLIRADARHAPFPDRAFDGVFSNSLLHHLTDPTPVWREIRRLAAPGAVVLIRDLHRPASRAQAAAIVRAASGDEPPLLQTLFYNSLLAAFTVEEVRRQLADAGITGLTVEKTTERHLDVYGRPA